MARPKRSPAPPPEPPRFLNIRTGRDLEALLQRELDELKARGVKPELLNRSVLVRSLLFGLLDGENGGTNDNDRVPVTVRFKAGAAREILNQVLVAMETASQRAVAEMILRLPELIEEELGFRPRPREDAPRAHAG